MQRKSPLTFLSAKRLTLFSDQRSLAMVVVVVHAVGMAVLVEHLFRG